MCRCSPHDRHTGRNTPAPGESGENVAPVIILPDLDGAGHFPGSQDKRFAGGLPYHNNSIAPLFYGVLFQLERWVPPISIDSGSLDDVDAGLQDGAGTSADLWT